MIADVAALHEPRVALVGTGGMGAMTAVATPARRRWIVSAFCPLTGPWRGVVLAATAAGAIAEYCAEHGMDPRMCEARPV